MKTLTLVLLPIALFAVFISGCGSTSTKAPAAPAAPKNSKADKDHSEHGDHSKAGKQTPMEKMKVELAKLSPADAAAAEKQHMCPVSGEMLGTMGVPKKIDVKGQSVWVCCDKCKKSFLEEPDKYLAKLHK